jgi:hypothetical protein
MNFGLLFPFRNAPRVAEDAATVDVLSNSNPGADSNYPVVRMYGEPCVAPALQPVRYAHHAPERWQC